MAGAIYWGDAGATLISNSREKEYGVAVTVDVPMAEWIPHLLGLSPSVVHAHHDTCHVIASNQIIITVTRHHVRVYTRALRRVAARRLNGALSMALFG